MKISQRNCGFNVHSRRLHMSYRQRWPIFVLFFIHSIVFCEIFIQNVIHSIIMKFHSFLENIHFIVFEFHSIQKNIHVLTRAVFNLKFSFNSKKILVIHSKKLFIFLKNHLSNTPTSGWHIAQISLTWSPGVTQGQKNQ